MKAWKCVPQAAYHPTFQVGYHLKYSLFILIMCIPFLGIGSPRDFVKCISEKLGLWTKKLIALKLSLRGKIKKVLSRAHVRSLKQRAWNVHDDSEQTLNVIDDNMKWFHDKLDHFIMLHIWTLGIS